MPNVLVSQGADFPPVFSPASIAGLYEWFDTSRQTVVADGTALSSITDNSSNGRNLTRSGTAPTYRTSVVNGYPVVRFGGAGDTQLTSSAAGGMTSQTLFVVGKATSTAGQQTMFAGGANALIAFFSGTTLGFVAQKQGTAGIFSGGAATVNTWQVWTVTVTSGAQGFWISGTSTATGTSSSWAPLSTGTTTWFSSGSQAYIGDVAEWGRYNTILSNSDRIALHTYLGAKYGITMGGN